jgi:fatty-acyl-CoA synthase
MKRVQRDMFLSEITIAYGMTETSPVSFQSATDTPLAQRVSTVGRILPHLSCKIVDEIGRLVPVGHTGELCTRGYSVFQGYWNDPKKTAASLREGWMFTGDLATFDHDGYCNIVGRVKDMIIRGGENIYPREVEEFLFTHPAVSAVQVFGIPDSKFGEVVCAWIVPRTGIACTAADIQAFCKQNMAHFKCPTHVRFVTELPITVTGKPQKFLMRDAMVKELSIVPTRTA